MLAVAAAVAACVAVCGLYRNSGSVHAPCLGMLNRTNPGPSHDVFNGMGWDGMRFFKRGMGWDGTENRMGWDGTRFFQTWDGMEFFELGMGWDEIF